ncbi:hypothetical protein [Helicobacter cinaedi]|uniref:hypothetical protein n=1 Tax=Helicobacter cinaedi TaxID=213 RepID=UPI0021630760|nr:hypothetical protein [Helicobacter cinaedi]
MYRVQMNRMLESHSVQIMEALMDSQADILHLLFRRLDLLKTLWLEVGSAT